MRRLHGRLPCPASLPRCSCSSALLWLSRGVRTSSTSTARPTLIAQKHAWRQRHRAEAAGEGLPCTHVLRLIDRDSSGCAVGGLATDHTLPSSTLPLVPCYSTTLHYSVYRGMLHAPARAARSYYALCMMPFYSRTTPLYFCNMNVFGAFLRASGKRETLPLPGCVAIYTSYPLRGDTEPPASSKVHSERQLSRREQTRAAGPGYLASQDKLSTSAPCRDSARH